MRLREMSCTTLPMVKCDESDILTEACLDDIAQQINERQSRKDPIFVLRDFDCTEPIGYVTEATVIKEEAFWIELQVRLFSEVVKRLDGWKAEGLKAFVHFSGALIKFKDKVIGKAHVREIDRIRMHSFSIYPEIRKAKPALDSPIDFVNNLRQRF